MPTFFHFFLTKNKFSYSQQKYVQVSKYLDLCFIMIHNVSGYIINQINALRKVIKNPYNFFVSVHIILCLTSKILLCLSTS